MKDVVCFTITNFQEDILMLLLDEIWKEFSTFNIYVHDVQVKSIEWKWRRITEQMEKFNFLCFNLFAIVC